MRSVRKKRVSPLPEMTGVVPRRRRSHAWRDEYLEPLRYMLMGGASDFEIAEALNIHPDTLYGWRESSPALRQMLHDFKEGFDIRIERTLAAKALGYTYKAEKIFMSDGQVHRIEYLEHVPPDTVAMKFWLASRQPKQWREAAQPIEGGIEHSGSVDIEQVDNRKLAMTMLNVIREGMMKSEQRQSLELPAYSGEFDGKAAATDQAGAPGAAERTGGDPAASPERPGAHAGQDRPGARERRRGFTDPRHRDEDDLGLDD